MTPADAKRVELCRYAVGDCEQWRSDAKSEKRKRYPMTNIDGKPVLVRRFLFELSRGKKLDPETYLRPTCMNPYCVKPEHQREESGDTHRKHAAKDGNVFARPSDSQPARVEGRTQPEARGSHGMTQPAYYNVHGQPLSLSAKDAVLVREPLAYAEDCSPGGWIVCRASPKGRPLEQHPTRVRRDRRSSLARSPQPHAHR